MKLAILGGSFNPIHIGHLHLADSALSVFGFDRLLLVPANISPFKQGMDCVESGTGPEDITVPAECPGASATDRLDMILASITADPRIAVEDLELRRGGVSYTIDTVKEIINRYHPEGKPALILGDDLIADFSKWKDAEELAGIADIIVARRIAGLKKIKFPYPYHVLNNEVMDISSAMIRERITKDDAGSKAWHYLVPGGAQIIIKSRKLYQAIQQKEKDTDNRPKSKANREITVELIARVEEEARLTLSAKRFIHSRNTALMARDIAFRYNLDADAAYLAGIAHDMAKNQSTSLDHGKKAAVLLYTRFNIHNKDVQEAIEVHTTGKPGMGDLAKAVFIADKIEFSRSGEHSKLRDMIAGKAAENTSSLDELFYTVLKSNISWLKEAGIKASKKTLRLLEEK